VMVRPLHSCEARCSHCRSKFTVCPNAEFHVPMHLRPKPMFCKDCKKGKDRG
jgi:hypothetical protein